MIWLRGKARLGSLYRPELEVQLNRHMKVPCHAAFTATARYPSSLALFRYEEVAKPSTLDALPV